MASNMGKAMVNFIAVFHKYSGQEGDKFKLSKTELKALLNAELGGFLGDPKDPKSVDKIMHTLDMDGDGQVDFQEFICIVTALTVACFGSCTGAEESCQKMKKVSTLTHAMVSLTEVFHKYSGREGDKNKLSKGELKTLFKEELGDMLNNPKDPSGVDSIMTDLDVNKDGEVDFKEYSTLFAALTMSCNEFFKGRGK